jgi:ATP-binding cassette subfamily B protein
VDIRELETGHYRRQIGMVLQDPYLFHGTVLENIRYGLPEASAGDVIAAAQAANAHDFVVKLPHGYDTVVGERGHTLSGGERQRVAVARALFNEPRVIVADEPSGDLDRPRAEALHTLLLALPREHGTAVVVATHNEDLARRTDRVFSLCAGRLARI